jgi:hypothetical protein
MKPLFDSPGRALIGGISADGQKVRQDYHPHDFKISKTPWPELDALPYQA